MMWGSDTFNPLHTEFLLRKYEYVFAFISFPHSEITHIVEILPVENDYIPLMISDFFIFDLYEPW